jgi:acetylornithine deacetylase/succinyl-diaminopimelate desuccinylase-like protein
MESVKYIENNRDRIISDLNSILRQKSLSPTGEGIRECAELVSNLCLDYGFDSSDIVETDGNPGIVAEKRVGEDAPTVVFFGHYDVQSVEEDQWSSPPFEPEIREEDGSDRIFARGSGDNKGQFFTHLCAVDMLGDNLEANILLVLEGEEEKGSPNLEQILENEKLEDVDVLICVDGSMEVDDLPTVELGCRGMLYTHLEIETGSENLHSGKSSGMMRNAAFEVSKVLESLEDDQGNVEVENFYENVREPDESSLKNIRDIEKRTGFDKEGDDNFGKGKGLEKNYIYPQLNIAGVKSGYGGKGTETVIPSSAEASIGVRMVADQSSSKILEKLEKHIETVISEDTDFSLTEIGSVEPYKTDPGSDYIETVKQVLEEIHGQKPLVKPTSSASLPFHKLNRELDVECLLVPYANHDENQHAPDENLKVELFRKGVICSARIMEKIGEKEKQI